MIEVLKGKGLSKKHKQSLCLVWFVHNILWARDVNNNISLSLIKFFEDLEAFNSYSWGYESFKMTVKYLLTPLVPKIVNLNGFPWAFMVNISFFLLLYFHFFYLIMVLIYWRYFIGLGVWSHSLFETTSELPGRSFLSKNLEMISAKTDKNKKFLDLFNLPKEAVSLILIKFLF